VAPFQVLRCLPSPLMRGNGLLFDIVKYVGAIGGEVLGVTKRLHSMRSHALSRSHFLHVRSC